MTTSATKRNRLKPSGQYFPKLKIQSLLLVLVAIAFYAQTIGFDYALDDGLVLHDNPYVLNGLDFENGIKPIFTKDTYHGFYEKVGSAGELTGGRYRPLSVFTFAIEYELFGLNPALSHFLNILFYAATLIMLLLLFNNYFFPCRPELGFLSVLIFAIHPIHTEVIANIKSRDEIMSLLMLISSLYLLFRHLQKSKEYFSVDLGWALLLYFLALLSKENGITFLAVIPITLFVFTKYKWQQAIKYGAIFSIPAAIYLIIRFSIVGFGANAVDDVMNDPFLLASIEGKYATVLVILLHYLKLLVFPHPLSYDYSFFQIPYYNFSSFWPWFSIIIHTGLVVFALKKFRKNAVLPFAILFYVFTISIVSNLFIDLGGTMGERLIYHSSLGFSMAIAYLLVQGFRYLGISMDQPNKNLGWLVVIALVLLCGYKTVTRNEDWQNNRHLFLSDVETVPESVRANVAAAGELIDIYFENPTGPTQEKLSKAYSYLDKAERLYPHSDNYLVTILLQKGYAAFYSGDLTMAEMSWLKAASINRNHAKLQDYFHVLSNEYHQQGRLAGSQKEFREAIEHFKKAVEYDPDNASIWYDLGGAYFTINQYQLAADAFRESIRLNPHMKEARQGLQAAESMGNPSNPSP